MNVEEKAGHPLARAASEREIPADRPCAVVRLVVHDARTPLNAVRGFGELLLAGAGGPLPAEALEFARQIARASRALEEVLGQLEELAALRGVAPAAPAAVDLARLLREEGFESAPAEPEAWVRGDPAAWRRVLALCRAYLAPAWSPVSGDEPRPAVAASVGRAAGEDRLELSLRRSGGTADGTGLLALELARRLAARDGGDLALADPDRLVLTLPVAKIESRSGQARPRGDAP